MRMLGFFKKKEKEKIEIKSPAKGKAVSIKTVNDPTFAEEILGKGVAVIPEDGHIYAPVDGTITLLFDTLHAISITSKEGAEVLVHVGLDTVSLKGEHFTAHVKTGDAVKKGDLMLTVDIEAVKAAGFDIITPIIICNSDDYEQVEAVTDKSVGQTDTVLSLTAK